MLDTSESYVNSPTSSRVTRGVPAHERQTNIIQLDGPETLTSADVEALTSVFNTTEQVLPALSQKASCRLQVDRPRLEGTRHVIL